MIEFARKFALSWAPVPAVFADTVLADEDRFAEVREQLHLCLACRGENGAEPLEESIPILAGEDPLPWLEKYRDRFRAVHLKDVAVDPDGAAEGGWADLGDGRVDWSHLLSVLASAEAIVYIAEQDDPSDYVRFARRARQEISGW